MSRWWRDSLLVRLGPARVRLARVPRMSGTRVPPWSEYPVTSPATPVEALAAALEERRWRGTEALVSLHARFVRWTLLSFDDAIATDDEWRAFARVEFEGVHGDRARDWRIGILPPRFAMPTPACAVAASLVDDVTRVCATADVRVARLVPAFSSAFDAQRNRLRSAIAAFALVQDDRFTLAVLEGGRWCALESGRVGVRLADTLEAAIVRADAGQLSGTASRRLWVEFDGQGVPLPAKLGDWDVVAVDAASRHQPGGWRSRLGLAGG